MKKNRVQGKVSSFLREKTLLIGASIVSFLMVWTLWSFIDPWAKVSALMKLNNPIASKRGAIIAAPRQDPPEREFYDDPSLRYSFGSPVKDWDEKRRQWLRHHPSFAAGACDQVVVVTGSQPSPCENPIGDHLQLRLFKNKVDYCRIHGYDIFYNNAFLHPKMLSVWAKLPPVRAAMVTHPEAEWIWWLDSDTVLTDMEFKLPLEKYRNHNFIINGWEQMIYEKKSWLGMNTGVFLIRNCQWSMDFIEAWASMSPLNPNHENLAETVRSTLTDKLFPGLDEQSSMVYMMLTQKDKWGDKVYLENQYSFSGYWAEIVDSLDNISNRYAAMEAAERGLRRRHGEKVSPSNEELREKYLKDTYDGKGGWRRPFITHFTGCQPCSGHYNPAYGKESCWKGMKKSLNFADNQVLRNYGFVHVDLLNSSFVSPLQFVLQPETERSPPEIKKRNQKKDSPCLVSLYLTTKPVTLWV